MFNRELNYHFLVIAGRAKGLVAAVSETANTLAKIFLTHGRFETAVHPHTVISALLLRLFAFCMFYTCVFHMLGFAL